MQAKFVKDNFEFSFSDDDVVNPDELESNCYKRMYYLHDHGFCVAVVFADDENEALDIAADDDKLERFAVTEEERADYEDDEGITLHGNYGNPFDIANLGIVVLEKPKLSVAACFAAAHDYSDNPKID